MDTEFNILLKDLDFPEGPCFDAKGRLWCTEILSGNLVCYDQGEIYCYHVGEKVNGAAIDGRDHVWFTDSEKNLIGVLNPENGQKEIVCDNVGGYPLNRPNDLAFDSFGNLIVSCHGDGRSKPTGSLIVLDKNNNAKTILKHKYFPNGIAFSRDCTFFIYSETYNQQLWKAWWDMEKKVVTREQPFAKSDGPIGPDGIAFDDLGYLYVTVFDQSKIDIIDPQGNITDDIPLSYQRPTSCAFDPLGKLGLIVTEAQEGLLISINTKSKGEKIFKRDYEKD